MDKLPPPAKIYEAYSAIADGRVRMQQNQAFVKSSDNSKEYTVTWQDDVYSSNDNASYWQGYAGYPMIAVLMIQGNLPLDKEIAFYFVQINWKELNARYKAKYDKAVDEILENLDKQGIDTNTIREEVSSVYQHLSQLPVRTKRSSLKPPKSNLT